jgi:hypothetical protein
MSFFGKYTQQVVLHMVNRQALRFAYFLPILIFPGSLKKDKKRNSNALSRPLNRNSYCLQLFMDKWSFTGYFFPNHLIKTGL